jgi:phenylpyruvate tautomerase PptA (4-oxalocrotonate tautomerase family)
MPVLEVELTGGVTGPLREGLAQRLADAAGAIFRTAPGQTWVRLRDTLPGDYAENGTDALAAGVHPVFVRVLKRAQPEGPLLVEEVQALTEAVAMATGRPSDQVHVAYEPSGAGRVSFGGRIVR